MKDMKFEIKSEQHSKEIQEELFKLGFKWASDSFTETRIKYLNKLYLFATAYDKTITYGMDQKRFDKSDAIETTLEELKEMNSKKKRHVHADLIIAWANGAEIQVHDTGEWLDVIGTPSWFTDSNYRIKPEPSDYEKYGVEIGDIWLCGKTRDFDCVAGISYKGKPMSLKYSLSPIQIEEIDILVFRKGVVDRTREFTL